MKSQKDTYIIYSRDTILKRYLETVSALFKAEHEISDTIERVEETTGKKVIDIKITNGTAKMEVENDPRTTRHAMGAGNSEYCLSYGLGTD